MRSHRNRALAILAGLSAALAPVTAWSDGGADGDRASIHASCAGEAASLRAVLVHDAGVADTWNLGWRIGFTAAAVGQLGAAATGWFDKDFTYGLWINGGKAALAAGTRWLMPLRVPVPAATADPCADVAALRAALETAGKRERANFWMSHVGGLALNIAGLILVGEGAGWGNGALSFAISYPVGLAHVYTAPRGSWHAWRDARSSWSATVSARREGGWMIGAAGTF